MRNVTILLAVVVVVAMAAPAYGNASWNVAGPAPWSVSGNWLDGQMPDYDNHEALIYNGGICEIRSGTDAEARCVNIGSTLGGELQVLDGSTLDVKYALRVGFNAASGTSARYIQTGGTVTVDETAGVGMDWAGSSQLLSISGGSFTVDMFFRVGEWSVGTFEVIGGNAVIDINGDDIHDDGYTQTSFGTLLAEVNASGLTTVAVTGNAVFDGTFTVVDDGAAATTYILMTYDSKSGSFTGGVNLPSGDWSYNLGDTSLTVTKVPEPMTLTLLGLGGLGVLLRRQRARKIGHRS